MAHHLVGTSEIADLLGLSRQRVHQLTETADFPPPVADLKSGRIWERAAVETWIATNPQRASADSLEHKLFAELTDAGTRAMVAAKAEARRLRHGYVGTEHLLLAVLGTDCPDVSQRLRVLGLDHDDLERRILETTPAGDEPPTGNLPFTGLAFHALQSAVAAAHESGAAGVEPRHITIAALLEADGLAARLAADIVGTDTGEVAAQAGELLDTSADGFLATATPAALNLSCSFCSKSQNLVEKLIAGPGVYICNECIDLCHDIVTNDLTVDQVNERVEARRARDHTADLARLDALAAEIADIRQRLVGKTP